MRLNLDTCAFAILARLLLVRFANFSIIKVFLKEKKRKSQISESEFNLYDPKFDCILQAPFL